MENTETAEQLVDDLTLSQKREKEYPGKINMAHERGHYSGCACKTFMGVTPETLDKQVNDFFAEHPNRLVVESTTGFAGGYIIKTYHFTKVLTQEELDEHTMAYKEAERIIEERKAERSRRESEAKERAIEQEKKAKVEAAAKEKELRDLAEKGRRCEKNHGKLIKMEREGKK